MSVHPLDLLLSALCFLVGGAFSVAAFTLSRHVRRVLREKTSRVAELGSGPAEIEGELRALDPIVALDGTRAVAVRWSMQATGKKDENESQIASATHTACSPVEVIDDSGSCLLEMDQLLILGHRQRHVLTALELKTSRPDLWPKVPVPEGEGWIVDQILIEETSIPDGARGFVSGEAVLDDAPGLPAGYRDGKRRFKLRGDDRRPLIVSAWPQRHVLRALLGPVLRILFLGLLAFLLSAAALVVPPYLRSRAGL